MNQGFLTGIIVTAVVGTAFGLGAKQIERFFWPEGPTAQTKLITSSFAPFAGQQSIEVMQLIAYEVFMSDFVKDIKVTATFGKSTEIIQHNVLYSSAESDEDGFEATFSQKGSLPQKNVIILSLKQKLNEKQTASIYFLTKRIVANREEVKLEVPKIKIEGKDKNGRDVYH